MSLKASGLRAKDAASRAAAIDQALLGESAKIIIDMEFEVQQLCRWSEAPGFDRSAIDFAFNSIVPIAQHVG